MIEVILWDVDGTLLDFLAAERRALRECFARFRLGDCPDDRIGRYSLVNRGWWERLERGEVAKEELLYRRFEEFFASEGLPACDARAFNREYQLLLGDTVVFRDNACQLIQELKDRGVEQYAATNGTLAAQERKLEKSGLGALLDGVFISELVGAEKPSPAFFDAVFQRLGPRDRDKVLMVGDSLTSDMRGGNNAGIRCCWYNPQGAPRDDSLRIDFEIQNLNRVKELLNEA